MKFWKYGDNKRTQQKFNKDITFIKYGKPIKIYDFIQESANETDIYKNLEKYGSIENALAIMNRIRPQIMGDFEKLEDLRSIEEKRIQVENIWNQLPVEMKDKFNNNISDFMDNGYKFFKEMEQAEIEKIQKAQQQNDSDKGGKNGTKE